MPIFAGLIARPLIYQPDGESVLNLELMPLVDEQYLETHWFGAGQRPRHLRRPGYGGESHTNRLSHAVDGTLGHLLEV